MRYSELAEDSVIYWIRSYYTGGKERIPMFYKGRWSKNCEDGLKGDVKARPIQLGPGPFTATYAPDAFETENGTQLC